MTKEFDLSKKIKETNIIGEFLFTKHVREFIKIVDEELDRLKSEEEKVHKNHRVQALLRDLKIFLKNRAGEKIR